MYTSYSNRTRIIDRILIQIVNNDINKSFGVFLSYSIPNRYLELKI